MQPAATTKISRYSPVAAIAIAQTTAPINEPNVFAKLNAANERPTERTSGNVARFNPWLTPSYTTYAKPANSAYSATAIALSIGVNGSTTATTNNKQAAIAGIRESLKARGDAAKQQRSQQRADERGNGHHRHNRSRSGQTKHGDLRNITQTILRKIPLVNRNAGSGCDGKHARGKRNEELRSARRTILRKISPFFTPSRGK